MCPVKLSALAEGEIKILNDTSNLKYSYQIKNSKQTTKSKKGNKQRDNLRKYKGHRASQNRKERKYSS